MAPLDAQRGFDVHNNSGHTRSHLYCRKSSHLGLSTLMRRTQILERLDAVARHQWPRHATCLLAAYQVLFGACVGALWT